MNVSRTRRRLALRALGVVLVAWTSVAPASWVTEGLEVGLHEEATLDSPITGLLRSGTELEVLERIGAVVRVRAEDGNEGWMDNRYVTDQPPAITLLQTAREAVREAQTQLETLGARVQELEAQATTLGARSAEVGAERDALRAELDAERMRLARTAADHEAADRERSRLQAELDSIASAPPAQSESLSKTLRDVQRLAEENSDLKQELAILEANQEMVASAETIEPVPVREPESSAGAGPETSAGVAVRGPGTPAQPNLLGFLDWRAWQWMLLGSALLLAFGAGGYVVDLGIRRRHGGFRI